jgi:cold shock CspA family protein
MSTQATASAQQASAQQASAQQTTHAGCVKWFNTKAGYGFITLKNDSESREIFVHHTELQVGESQYRYLVQGEYVEFVISPIEDDKHDCCATAVRGIQGGKLMCETRNETRKQIDAPVPVPQLKGGESEWMIVPRRTYEATRGGKTSSFRTSGAGPSGAGPSGAGPSGAPPSRAPPSRAPPSRAPPSGAQSSAKQ